MSLNQCHKAVTVDIAADWEAESTRPKSGLDIAPLSARPHLPNVPTVSK